MSKHLPKPREGATLIAASARAMAVQQLNRVEKEGAFVGLVGKTAFDLDADPREERQATEYIAGVTRWRRWLDFLIAQAYRGDFEKMEPMLRQVLRVGLYDLLFLYTPPHAALNEAVELAKRLVRPGAGGLANGLLRNLLRRKDHLPQPHTGDVAEDLALRRSHPTWLVRRWLARFGLEETEQLLDWNNARPVYGLRHNPLKTDTARFHRMLVAQGVEATPSPYLEEVVRVRKLQPVIRAGWLAEGLCVVQDESAGLIVRLLDPQPGETILDLCAAPGAKALYAASRMQGQGRLLAFDANATRLGLVARAATAHGLDHIHTEAADLREIAARSAPPQGDRVLLDTPCSGLGVLSKRADLRWRRTSEAFRTLMVLQDELLDAAAMCVRPGGLLVYSTCTIASEENQERITAFLQRHSDFIVETVAGFVPAEMVTPEGYYATLPHRHHIDGAFGVRLRKQA